MNFSSLLVLTRLLLLGGKGPRSSAGASSRKTIEISFLLLLLSHHRQSPQAGASLHRRKDVCVRVAGEEDEKPTKPNELRPVG